MSLFSFLLDPLARRPLVCLTLCWIAGIVLARHCPLLWWAWLPAAGLLLCAWWLGGTASTAVRAAAPALAICCLAAAMSSWQETPPATASPHWLPDGDIAVAGYALAPAAASNRAMAPPSWSMPFQITARREGGRWVVADVAVYLSGQTAPPMPGSLYQLSAGMQPLEEPGNPFGFSWRTFLAERNLRYRVRALSVIPLDQPTPAVRLAGWREQLFQRLTAVMPGNYPLLHAQLLNSIVLGAHGDPLPDELVTQFRKAGTIHLMIVSGNQVTLFAGLLVLPLCLLPYGGSRATYPRLRMLLLALSLPLLWLYVLLADSGPSMHRAVLMVLLTALSLVLTCSPLARARTYRIDGPTLLSAAALAMLIPNPALLFSPGLQITFIAILGLMIITPVLVRLGRRALGRLAIVPAVALGAQLATYPILAWHFGTLPLLGPAANMVEEPLVTALLPLALLTFIFAMMAPPLAWGLNLLNVAMMNVILGVNALVAGWSWACPIFFVRSPLLVVVYAAVVLAAVRRLRRLADRLEEDWAVHGGREPVMW